MTTKDPMPSVLSRPDLNLNCFKIKELLQRKSNLSLASVHFKIRISLRAWKLFVCGERLPNQNADRIGSSKWI